MRFQLDTSLTSCVRHVVVVVVVDDCYRTILYYIIAYDRRNCVRHVVVVAAAAAKTACSGACSCGMFRLLIVSPGV